MKQLLFLVVLALVSSNSSKLKLKVALALRIVSIDVPGAVMNSSQLALSCHFDLQGDQLYSVKWYRNYVEFYRYQQPVSFNSDSIVGIAGNSTASNESCWKHEFELDGISLNLSRSNSTHVYLRQTSLASEGTYKCEVSADSPSFATVSIERQLKVYVLPKQKLSIVDNTLFSIHPSQQQHLQQQQQQQSLAKQQIIYNLNDLVNLTCISGPSKPAAKLGWLLNDVPISSSSKWLTHSKQTIKFAADNQQLVESKLTIAFRLQSHLLRQNGTSLTEQQMRQQLLKLKCIARLELEFVSETSIAVSGGKTSTRSRQASQLPVPASLQANSPSSTADESLLLFSANDHLEATSAYRWPRSQQHRSLGTNRRDSFADAWITGSIPVDDGLDSGDPVVGSTIRNKQTRQGVVWTNRQLRAQADHIDQMLRLSKPNEMSQPIIEAKLRQEIPFNDDEGELQSEFESNSDLATSTTTAFSENFELNLSTQPPALQGGIQESYEMNDLVQFICDPRVSPSSERDVEKRVQISWFINKEQINITRVNAFDGSKFYYLDQDSRWETRIKPSIYRHRVHVIHRPSISMGSSSEQNTEVSTINNETTDATTTTTRDSSSAKIDDGSLFIEFSSSLFQIKELNLKCRVIVEQPLIEYESQLVASISTNQYIQADSHNKAITRNSPGSVVRNLANRHNNRHQKNRLNASQPSSSHSITLQASCLAFVPIIIVTHLMLAQFNTLQQIG